MDEKTRIANDNKQDALRPIIVLIDMDGVVANFDEQIRIKTGIDVSQRTTPEIPEQHIDRVREEWAKPGFFKSMPIMRDAKAAVKKLLNNPRFSVYFCTAALSASETCASEKIAWVSKHFGSKMASERVIICKEKTLVRGDILIDDRDPSAKSRNVPTWRHVVFDHPSNETLPPHLPRLRGWKNLEPLLDELFPVNPAPALINQSVMANKGSMAPPRICHRCQGISPPFVCMHRGFPIMVSVEKYKQDIDALTAYFAHQHTVYATANVWMNGVEALVAKMVPTERLLHAGHVVIAAACSSSWTALTILLSHVIDFQKTRGDFPQAQTTFDNQQMADVKALHQEILQKIGGSNAHQIQINNCAVTAAEIIYKDLQTLWLREFGNVPAVCMHRKVLGVLHLWVPLQPQWCLAKQFLPRRLLPHMPNSSQMMATALLLPYNFFDRERDDVDHMHNDRHQLVFEETMASKTAIDLADVLPYDLLTNRNIIKSVAYWQKKWPDWVSCTTQRKIVTGLMKEANETSKFMHGKITAACLPATFLPCSILFTICDYCWGTLEHPSSYF